VWGDHAAKLSRNDTILNTRPLQNDTLISKADLQQLATTPSRPRVAHQDAHDGARILFWATCSACTPWREPHQILRRAAAQGAPSRVRHSHRTRCTHRAKVDGDDGIGTLVDIALACGNGNGARTRCRHRLRAQQQSLWRCRAYSYIAAEAGFASIIAAIRAPTIAPRADSSARGQQSDRLRRSQPRRAADHPRHGHQRSGARQDPRR